MKATLLNHTNSLTPLLNEYTTINIYLYLFNQRMKTNNVQNRNRVNPQRGNSQTRYNSIIHLSDKINEGAYVGAPKKGLKIT